MCLYIDAEEHKLGDLGEPANYKAALLDPKSEKWLNAMNVEMQSMKDNEVWVLVKSWDEVIDKMVNRLFKWKMKTLSIRGRLTLLKAVFGSMPIYHMSIFKVPMLVLQRMESIRCYFFNGNDLDSKRSIWVSWNKVLTSKEKGGLGVSSLFALNRALMFNGFGWEDRWRGSND
uniref:RNA-directed DNA polymerase, eukaryota, reverse transcriptase zinc-binding domain protein n=1 Tax=Tanacetum cinerariifolium TaxID=118510 RepID=A0A699Q7T5_TANCI|nr:RNA-directed DNA polymerase, eukaryota, reverse transcriptase zinc-binding domain protein [Tanacetum cinerariifolium]